MGTAVESYQDIERRINSMSQTDPEEIQNDINALKWQKGIYEHMQQSMAKSKVLSKSDVILEIEEAIADIDDLIASAYLKIEPDYEREFEVN